MSGVSPTALRAIAVLAILFNWANAIQIACGAFKEGTGGHPKAYSDMKEKPVFELCDTEREMPSVANLSRSLALDGSTVAPTTFLDAVNATSTAWTNDVGSDWDTVDLGAGGTLAGDLGSPLMGADVSCGATAGDNTDSTAWRHPTVGGTLSPITKDFVIEFVAKLAGSTVEVLFDSTDTNQTRNGIICWFNGTNLVVRACGNSGNAITIYTGLTNDAWYHVMIRGDVSDNSATGLTITVNSTTDATGANMSALGAITSTGRAQIGCSITSINYPMLNSRIAAFNYWEQADWLTATDTASFNVVASQRFRTLTGFRPQRHADTDVPITFQRNSAATIEKWNATSSATEYYTVGAHWLRCCRWRDTSGRVVTGYQSELTKQNKCVQSKTLGTTWTEVANNTSDDSYPGVGMDLDGVITPDATDTQHGWQQTITVTAAAWVVSGIARKGAQDWLYVADDTVANCWGYFDLDSGAPGNKGAGAASITLRDQGDVYLWELTFTGTAAAHTFSIYASDADDNAADPAYVGDAVNVDIHCGHVQAELGTVASSRIVTVASAVNRLKDEIEYTVNIPGSQGTIVCDYMIRSSNITVGFEIAAVSDGGPTNLARHKLTTGDKQQSLIGSTGSAIGSTTMSDGVIRRTGMTWKPGLLQTWISGAKEGTDDTTFTVPAAMTQCAVGMARTNTLQPSVPTLIRRIQVYERYSHDMAQLTGDLS